MEHHYPRESRLWAYINRNFLSEEDIRDIENFKSSQVNNKICLWDPRTNGIRYLKELVFNTCAALTEHEWGKLKKICGRDVGNPYAVKYHGELVCMDYLQAVLEIGFMENGLGLNGVSVVEIGAGYGRTCHALLSNFDVSRYTIIDLRNALGLARRYLKVVLNDSAYKKIDFVEVDHFDEACSKEYDLCINIDSFSEMDADTVKVYLQFIDERCGHFYVKNPVGKYLDTSIDRQRTRNEVVDMAMETGILRDIIDIYDLEAASRQAEKFVTGYCPSIAWSCLDHGWARPWSFYWQALYKRR